MVEELVDWIFWTFRIPVSFFVEENKILFRWLFGIVLINLFENRVTSLQFHFCCNI